MVLAAGALAQAGSPPVKVFILAGQSNMVGAGRVKAEAHRNGGKGSLENLVKMPWTAQRFAHQVDLDGQWCKREDVGIIFDDRKGLLTVGYGSNQETIGRNWGSIGC